MLFTHAVVGLLVGTAAAAAWPAAAGPALAGATLGSLLPDADVAFEHRRTLHFPSLAPAAAAAAIAVAAVAPGAVSVAIAAGCLAAALHARMDLLGGGLALRQWREREERAVYDHVRGRWLPARHLVHEGSTADLAVCLLAALPLLARWDGPARAGLVGLLLAGAVYSRLRRRIAALVPEEYHTMAAFVRASLWRTRRR
jgi:hypothetical protein